MGASWVLPSVTSFVTTVILLLLTGVHSVLVALMAAKAEVEFDPARVLPSQIANSITELGFPSTIIEEESGAGKVELEVTIVKFIYSEKATNFCEISTVDLSYVVMVKSMVEISQNFVAFSKYMNFTTYVSFSSIYINCPFC